MKIGSVKAILYRKASFNIYVYVPYFFIDVGGIRRVKSSRNAFASL